MLTLFDVCNIFRAGDNYLERSRLVTCTKHCISVHGAKLGAFVAWEDTRYSFSDWYTYPYWDVV
jgi:hypothetical protein